MEMKNPPPMMTEKMPTTKPPTRSSAVSRVSSQGASSLIHERSIMVLHPDARDDMHLLPLQRLTLEDGVFALAVNLRGSPRRLERLIVNQTFARSSRAFGSSAVFIEL